MYSNKIASSSLIHYIYINIRSYHHKVIAAEASCERHTEKVHVIGEYYYITFMYCFNSNAVYHYVTVCSTK